MLFSVYTTLKSTFHSHCNPGRYLRRKRLFHFIDSSYEQYQNTEDLECDTLFVFYGRPLVMP